MNLPVICLSNCNYFHHGKISIIIAIINETKEAKAEYSRGKMSFFYFACAIENSFTNSSGFPLKKNRKHQTFYGRVPFDQKLLNCRRFALSNRSAFSIISRKDGKLAIYTGIFENLLSGISVPFDFPSRTSRISGFSETFPYHLPPFRKSGNQFNLFTLILFI